MVTIGVPILSPDANNPEFCGQFAALMQPGQRRQQIPRRQVPRSPEDYQVPIISIVS